MRKTATDSLKVTYWNVYGEHEWGKTSESKPAERACADLDIGCVEVPKRSQSSRKTISTTADP